MPAGDQTSNSPDCPARWAKCGGKGFDGEQGCCQEDSECTYINDYYYQCLPGALPFLCFDSLLRVTQCQ